MDNIEKVKIAWKEKFASEIPQQFITRLECAQSKLENNLRDNFDNIFDVVKSETKLKIEELNSSLRKEEYFFDVISPFCEKKQASNQCSTEAQAIMDTSALYAKVNKPAKSKHDESQMNEKYADDQKMTDARSTSHDDSYEEIGMPRETDSNMKQSKLRGSVKARIQMFERSDSSSGEEVHSAGIDGGEYARLAIRPTQAPPVSPKPSPAIRRKPRSNDYEEISLPGAGTSSNKQDTDPGDTNTHYSCPSTSNTDKCSSDVSSCSNSKQEDHNLDNIKTLSNPISNSNATVQGKKQVPPPVPLRRSRGNECINIGDSDVLKKTEQLTLQYSEHEPQLATSRKQRCSDEVVKPVEKITSSDIHVHKRIDRNSEGIEGEYCAIADIKRDNNKHVTLVQVKSASQKNGKSSALLRVKHSDKELSKSHDNLSSVGKDGKDLSKSSVSKSMENIKQTDDEMKNKNGSDEEGDDDDDYSHLDYSSFKKPSKPLKNSMKKLFHRKTSGSISETKQTDGQTPEAVVGTRYKSLSSGSEEDLSSTVNVNIGEILGSNKNTEEVAGSEGNTQESDTDSKPESPEPVHSKSPDLITEKQKRRKGVPDYEKWDFQHLLTKTGISLADTDNFTDTGSEDDAVYDNNVPEKHKFQEHIAGQSDDSGVLVSETSLTPDDTNKDSEVELDITDGAVEDSSNGKSTSTDASRLSTACKYKCDLLSMNTSKRFSIKCA